MHLYLYLCLYTVPTLVSLRLESDSLSVSSLMCLTMSVSRLSEVSGVDFDSLWVCDAVCGVEKLAVGWSRVDDLAGENMQDVGDCARLLSGLDSEEKKPGEGRSRADEPAGEK